ncbi:MAG: hypothetical protein JST76_12505, partial [Bacteroidetes bacterium]|nr:hypothetical protein [Bacteroidota bacterium]
MDTLKSLWEDFSERIKSPFVTSFIFVWSVKNWILLYTIFNFDSSYSLNSKTEFIKDYIAQHPVKIFWGPLGLSIVAAISFYAMKSIFYGIDSFYENKIKIWIISIFNPKNLVLKADLETAYLKNAELLANADAERKLFMTSNTKIAELQNQLTVAKREIGEL